MKTPLRRKILFFSSSLLVGLIIAMLVLVGYQAEAFVNERITGDIEAGRERIHRAEQERIQTLGLTSGLLASLPILKAALDTKDAVTIRDVLSDYLQQVGSSDLFIVLDTLGNVVARTDTTEPLPVPRDFEAGILKTPTATYLAAKSASELTGAVLGYVIAGAQVDDRFAKAIQETINDDVIIVDDRVLGTSLSRATLPAQSQAEWEALVGRDGPTRIVQIHTERYGAVATSLGIEGGPRPLAVIMQSQTRAMQPYRNIQRGLLLLGIGAAIAGIAMSAVLARTVTSPVAKLVEGTRQVATGNFDYRLDVQSTDEIGDLAASFNKMIQGLRERADMQKFVSVSTVEMIQSSHKKVSAGEKMVLTIFFSDMRGFTSMTENRPPEEIVKLLNTCLSLQAEKVKKFHGDIDKYVGDCVVALFQGEDMELNAIRCAVEAHRALDEWNMANPSNPPIHIGIGIVTGEVILGSIGSEDRLDYTIIGSNVNLCSRLCSKAGPGETLLAESTYARVKGLVAAQRIDPIQVKGFTDPIPVYRMGA
jgi:class 3 adenylate cyclase